MTKDEAVKIIIACAEQFIIEREGDAEYNDFYKALKILGH